MSDRPILDACQASYASATPRRAPPRRRRGRRADRSARNGCDEARQRDQPRGLREHCRPRRGCDDDEEPTVRGPPENGGGRRRSRCDRDVRHTGRDEAGEDGRAEENSDRDRACDRSGAPPSPRAALRAARPRLEGDSRRKPSRGAPPSRRRRGSARPDPAARRRRACSIRTRWRSPRGLDLPRSTATRLRMPASPSSGTEGRRRRRSPGRGRRC